MASAPAIKVSAITLPGMRVIWPRLLALRLDVLAVVEGRDLLLLFTMEDGGPKLRQIRSLGYRPGSLALSASRGFLLVGNGSGNWFEVRDARTADAITAVAGPDRLVATFAVLDEVDVLVSAFPTGRVELIGLPDGDTVAKADLVKGKAFVVDDVVPVGDGQDLFIVGHPFLEGFARHLHVSTRVLQEGGVPLATVLGETLERPGHHDAGVGPCGWEEVVVHQGAGRWGAPQNAAEKGLTVRKLASGEILEKVSSEQAVGVRQGLMGTSLMVAFAGDGGVHMLPRKGCAAEPAFLPARAASFDQETGRIALATPDSKIQIVSLART